METAALEAELKEARAEAAKYRTERNGVLTALNFYINKYPLGDIDKFSISRAAMAKALSEGRMYGPYWDRYAKFEKAWMEAEVEAKAAQGDQVSGVDGGFLAPEQWNATWFGLLRSQSVLDQLSITRLSVPARVEHIPNISNDVSVYYGGENTAATASQFSFGNVSYTAHKSTAFINVSNELIRDSAGLADQIFRDQTARAIATDRDTQLIAGTGSKGLAPAGAGAPTGLINHPVVQGFIYYPVLSTTGSITTTAASFTPSYQHLGQMITKIETLNGYASATSGQAKCDGAIAHTQFRQTVWSSPRLQDGMERPIWFQDLNSGAGMLGLQWALSSVVPNNLTLGGSATAVESLIIFGAWKNYVLFECQAPTYASSIFSGDSTHGFAQDQTQIRIVYRYDGGPAVPWAFGILAGVLV